MTSEIATAGKRSTKASKALNTMRARIVKADEARAAMVVQAATTATTANREASRGLGMPSRPMPPARPTPAATGQRWPTAPGTGGRARRATAARQGHHSPRASNACGRRLPRFWARLRAGAQGSHRGSSGPVRSTWGCSGCPAG